MISHRLLPFSFRPVLFSALVLLSAAPVQAQLVGTDTSPGDSCSGFPAGATRLTADADQNGKEVTLICDGDVWQAETVAAAGDTREIQFNNAGALTADSSFVYMSDGDLIVGSSQIDDTGTGSEDSRMYFDVSNSAFRAGFANDSEWDFASAGQYSAAMGQETVASGVASTAFGSSTTASVWASTALGYDTIASGETSTALGHTTRAVQC